VPLARDQRRAYQGQKYRCHWASDWARVCFGAHCGAVLVPAGWDSVMRGYGPIGQKFSVRADFGRQETG
jgi:hypothetical protein